MRCFRPKYQYFLDKDKSIRVRLTVPLSQFSPTLLNIGDLRRPSKDTEVVAVVFDLEGFTNFTKQVDPQLSIPGFLSDFFLWLFDGIKRQITEKKKEQVLWAELPFFSKFLGDGVLFLWKIDLDKISKAGRELDSPHLQSEIMTFVCNIVATMADLCTSYEQFYEIAVRKYVEPPTKLRCGIARGNVYPIGGGLDFVGPCINIASRIEKFNGLSFCFSTRGIDVDEFHRVYKKDFLRKRVNIMGIGDNELVCILKSEFDEATDELKGQFREV
jgi:class 3 adenylate cyclase